MAIGTYMYVPAAPSQSGARVTFIGYLRATATDEGIPGKVVRLIVNGVERDTKVTSDTLPGYWYFSFTPIGWSTKEMQVVFDGDAEYAGCQTDFYILEYKVATQIETRQEPLEVYPGVYFFCGNLVYEPYEGSWSTLNGKQVRIVVNGVTVGSYITGYDSRLCNLDPDFQITHVDMPVTHIVEFVFDGDEDFDPCSAQFEIAFDPATEPYLIRPVHPVEVAHDEGWGTWIEICMPPEAPPSPVYLYKPGWDGDKVGTPVTSVPLHPGECYLFFAPESDPVIGPGRLRVFWKRVSPWR